MEEYGTKSAVEPLSRRDFIKLIAGAGLGFGIALTGFDRMGFLNNASNSRKGNNLLMEASASHNAGGSWTTLVNNPSETVGIHAAYVWTGKIIMAEGSSFDKSNGGTQPPDNKPLRAEVYHPSSGSEKVITMGNFPEDADLFCCYQSQLPDGNILFAGGTRMYSDQHTPENCGTGWAGSTKAFRFNWQTENMEPTGSMREGRWYPTLVCLANGNVAAFSGRDSWGGGSFNQLVEVYNWETGIWGDPPQHNNNPSSYTPDLLSSCGDTPTYSDSQGRSISPELDEYPRCHLIPHPNPPSQSDTATGLVAVVGPDPTGVRTWSPNTGLWNTFSVSNAILDRFNGCSFLLPLENELPQQARIVLASGGSGGEGNGSSNTQMFTFTDENSATLTNLPALEYKRNYASQIILPDGKCVVFGGTDGAQGSAGIAQYTPEYLDSTNLTTLQDGWHKFNPASVKRTYHSAAVLLADGSVWTAGGTGSSNGNGLKDIEVFKPPYFGVTRPTISSVTNIGGYGGTMQINTPDAQQIDNTHGVSLVKLDAISHHFGADQRLVWLPIVSESRTSTSLLAEMPLSGVLAPQGYYMVHVLENDIPSQAKIIKIPGNPDQTTPLLTILSPSAAQAVSGPSGGFSITVQGTATDAGSGIQKVDVRIGTSNWVSASPSPDFGTLWTADVPVTSQGPTTIQAIATDNSQNTSSITIPIRVVFT